MRHSLGTYSENRREYDLLVSSRSDRRCSARNLICLSHHFSHVRLWNIPDKRVVHWTLIPAQASSQITAAQANLITAVNFCDEGRKVTVGTFDGRFLLYTDSLQYDVSSVRMAHLIVVDVLRS